MNLESTSHPKAKKNKLHTKVDFPIIKIHVKNCIISAYLFNSNLIKLEKKRFSKVSRICINKGFSNLVKYRKTLQH